MSSDPVPQAPEAAPAPLAPPVGGSVGDAEQPGTFARGTPWQVVHWMALVGLVAALMGLGLSVLLWQRLSSMQEQLARQSADSGANAVEARALARQAQEQSREIAARQAVTDNRLSEVALQRAQLEDLMQSLSRSRDENLLVDIDSAVRLAQQQAQLTGSAEPLLAALRSADGRLARVALPRLARVRSAIARDIERIRAASLPDVPGLLARLDELAREVDELPLSNAVPSAAAAAPRKAGSAPAAAWWQQAVEAVRNEARGLVRVSRIDQPEAALLAPEQAFFLRENIKFKLVNARLAVLARQTESARQDVAGAALALGRYFDAGSRRTQNAAVLLQQIQQQLRVAELPRIDESLAALSTAAAGR